jgi:hypothetical protein
MLELVLNRVAGVEAAIGNVSVGVTHIIGEMEVMGRNVYKAGRGQSHSTTVPIQHDPPNAGISSPSGGQRDASQSKAGGMVEDIATPHRPPKQPPSQPLEVSGTGMDRPILVDLDDTSSGSKDNGFRVEGRDRNAMTLGARVHSQPRLRAVPCARQLLAGAVAETTEDTSAEGSPSRAPQSTIYKDPPGYKDCTDFGTSTQLSYKVPSLHPKTNGVSQQDPPTNTRSSACSHRSELELISFVSCRSPSALARDAGYCTLASTLRLWARPRLGSTTSPAARMLSWLNDARKVSSLSYLKKSIDTMCPLYSPMIRTLAQTRCVMAMCAHQTTTERGCDGGPAT